MAGSRRGNITTPKNPPGDVRSRENASTRPSSFERLEKRQARHRASIACTSCRGKRVRCVVPKGKLECNQCIKSGSQCVIRNDDERKRPISKVYVASLCERIKILEGILLENGLIPPQAFYPSRTRQEATDFSDDSAQPVDIAIKNEQELDRPSPLMEFPSPSVSLNEDPIVIPENSDSASAGIPRVEASSEAQIGHSSSRLDCDFSCSPVCRKCSDANSAEALWVKRQPPIASRRASAPASTLLPTSAFQLRLAPITLTASFESYIPVPIDIHNPNLDYYDSSTNPLPSGSLGSVGGLSVTKGPVIKRQQEQSNPIPASSCQAANWRTRNGRQDHLFMGQHSVIQIPEWTTGVTFNASSALDHTAANAVQSAACTSAEQAVENISTNWDTAIADMTSPISLERLVQNVNRATGAETKRPVTSRKHELDYLSF